jgi:uncharacterized membrane protein YjgN (DUF898 family)
MTDLSLPLPMGSGPLRAHGTQHGRDFADTEPAPAHTLAVVFTGSGSEYFRIWIVNLLLTLVTLGLYYPWAKVRRLRYFHGNTLVGGRPLGFHAKPWKMLKGYLLVSLLLGFYYGAGYFNVIAGWIAFIAVMLIWPALLKSSLQFRLANTSWRGLRFRFTGDLRGAYVAVFSLVGLALLLVCSTSFVTDPQKPPGWYTYFIAAFFALTAALFPWLLRRLKAYQHNHFALASQHTELRATTGMFYKVFCQVLAGVAVSVAVVVCMVWLNALLGIIALALLFVALIKPYVATRMQNLVWTHTQTEDIRFHSRLKARAMMWLSIKNWLLVVFTLGLYWPFAAVARARLQLEAVTLASRIDLDALVSHARSHEGEAAGDAAGDLFGLDIGF